MRKPIVDGAVSKYLHGVAEDEQAPSLRREYDHCVVVPAFAEGALRPLIDSLRRAAAGSSLPTLLILVVNEPPGCDVAQHEANRTTVDWIVEQGPLQMCAAHRLVEGDALDVLLVERTRRTTPIPKKHGVGGARAVGMNIALGLIVGEVVGDPHIHSTDADAVVPEDYFSRPRNLDSAACVYPFEHSPPTDAMTAYELSLRYYVAGLEHADSPYAFHTIGSCMAIHATALAQVRGVPRRPAGEDFYLLNKVRKVGPVEVLSGEPLLLSSRVSNRTPFGTGRAVERLEGEAATSYDPRCFEILKAVRRELLSHGDGRSLDTDVLRACVSLFRARDDAAGNTTSEAAFMRRMDAHFDAFRTLKLIHHLTDEQLPKRALRDVLRDACFVPFEGRPGEILRALRRRQNQRLI